MIDFFIGMIKKPFIQIKYSMISLHVFAILIAFILYVLFKISGLNQEHWAGNYIEMLNTISLLSAFFVFGLEKLDFKSLLERYKKLEIAYKLPGGEVKVPAGELLVNTCLSIITIEVLLLAFQYGLYLIDELMIWPLILSIVYMVMGILIIIGLWHGTELNKK